jgi:hypothetical protein
VQIHWLRGMTVCSVFNRELVFTAACSGMLLFGVVFLSSRVGKQTWWPIESASIINPSRNVPGDATTLP